MKASEKVGENCGKKEKKDMNGWKERKMIL